MSNYSIINNWDEKDALDPGDPEKVIQASQFFQEFTAIATAISTKAESSSAVTSVNGVSGPTAVITSTDVGTGWGFNLTNVFRAVIAGGLLPGWNMTPSGGTAEEPQYITYASGVYRIRKTLTWTSGKVTSAVYEYSTNSGVGYSTILTSTIAYDGSDNVTGITWA